MNSCDKAIYKRLKTMVTESESCIHSIYAAPCVYARNMLLYQLKAKLNEIDLLTGMLCGQLSQMQLNLMVLPEQNQQDQRDLTLEGLAQFDGKNGKPAYVAVNGTIYDVTNNAAWAAASHFGLAAGKDLTGAFLSCHASQPVLSKLTVVGKLK